jgi:uncharacterized protein
MTIEQTKKSQGWKNVLGIIIPFFLVVGICQLIGYYLIGVDIMNRDNQLTTLQLFIVFLFSLIGTVLIVGVFMKYVDKKPFMSVGFQSQSLLKDTVFGVVLGFSMIAIGFFILQIMNQINIVKIQFNFLELLLSIGFFTFVAIGEELLFRGYILNNLMASFNKYGALLISSILFSLFHIGNDHLSFFSFMELTIAGILLGTSYIFTRSLWFPIALHFSWNFFQGSIFGFNVSGMKVYSLITTNLPTKNIWNGGDFGFEGSVISVIFHLIAILVIYKFFKDKTTNTLV